MYWPRYRYQYIKASVWDFPAMTPLSVNKWYHKPSDILLVVYNIRELKQTKIATATNKRRQAGISMPKKMALHVRFKSLYIS